ncbi:MAG: mechanosensitive ion channel family protein [Eubacteriales bacterium]|nr:mechanosensitive ion channel family protein [Eubacteriales bacterium]MDD3198745.1 mechanosensitive ion channel family protein [Eubacteriales bacterium]MDD4629009.1 mechanosensitive ion channel family protein [Eubacteriales bacterium]
MSDKTAEILIHAGIAFGIVLAGYILLSIACKIILKALRKSSLDEVLHTFIINSSKIVLWILIAVTALSYAGMPVSAFLAALGAAGLAIALALKDSLGNFAGGILIILTKPFKNGDYIEDYETAGQVETIDLLYTTLITYDNKVITIPNGKLANSTIVNHSSKQDRRVDCIFSVDPHEDIEKVKEILQAVVESNSDIYEEPVPIIGIAGQSSGKIDIDLRVWCGSRNYQDVKYYLEEQVKLAFEEANILMAYPKMEVRLKK